MSAFDDPWTADVEAAHDINALNAIYQRFSPGLDETTMGHLTMALNVRKVELESEPDPRQVVTSERILVQNEDDSYQAQQTYASALDRWAKADATYKKLRARTYLQFKAQEAPNHNGRIAPMSADEANMRADADDAVAAARLEANISEGLVKAARSDMDRLERQFQHHRSLMVREGRMDNRPAARG